MGRLAMRNKPHTEFSNDKPRENSWIKVIILILVVALVMYSMALGYEAMAAISIASAAGGAAVLVHRRLAH